ncbi:MAG: GNAT family N-acetyltransferase [Synechococcaceae cyanobacterium SM2_3_60]|nr:GNAT family N-acetyltransferase [Synechococcaceae cyanobacterium SM2_3_60]
MAKHRCRYGEIRSDAIGKRLPSAERRCELAFAIVGFAELEPNGHIDCFYVHKDYQGQGIGSLLYGAIERIAQQRGLRELWLEASLTALPFFLKQGFADLGVQTVDLAGVEFINHRLHKRIELL